MPRLSAMCENLSHAAGCGGRWTGDSVSRPAPFSSVNTNLVLRSSHQATRFCPYPKQGEVANENGSHRELLPLCAPERRQSMDNLNGRVQKPPLMPDSVHVAGVAGSFDSGALVPRVESRLVVQPSTAPGAIGRASVLGQNFPLPTIQSFNEYQRLVVEILDKSDMEFLGGKRIIKRSGWRKLALAFSVSFECRSEVIERDDAGNVTFARFCQVCFILSSIS